MAGEPLLLDMGEKKRAGALPLGKTTASPQKSSRLGSSDIKSIAKRRNVFKCNVGSRRSNPAKKAGTVDIKGRPNFFAYAVYFLKLGRRIESSVLGGVGKINHSGKPYARDFVGKKSPKKPCKSSAEIFSEFFGKGYNLVPGAFNRPRLVGGNVSRLGGNDPLKGFKQRGYYGFVGLGSARQKKKKISALSF